MLTDAEKLIVMCGLWTLATGTWFFAIVGAVRTFHDIRKEWRGS